MSPYILKALSFDLRELEFFIVGIHCFNLLFSWGSKFLYDFHELRMWLIPPEQSISEDELSNDTPCRPDINLLIVVGIPKD